jgi:hypothetical protein
MAIRRMISSASIGVVVSVAERGRSIANWVCAPRECPADRRK